MKYIEIIKRNEYLGEKIEDDDTGVYATFGIMYAISFAGIVISLLAFLFELIINFSFALISIQYMVFFIIAAFIIFMIASSGYNKEK